MDVLNHIKSKLVEAGYTIEHLNSLDKEALEYLYMTEFYSDIDWEL
jgi:hypothetical protein